jgi:hypothetical protein
MRVGSKPEVDELCRSVGLTDHGVARRYVVVEDAQLVRVLQRLADLRRDMQGLRRLEAAVPLHQPAAVNAVDELHDDEFLRFVAGVEDGDDVRMLEARAQLGFPLEAPHRKREVGEGLGDELDRDVALEPLVARSEMIAIPPAPMRCTNR